MLSASNLSQFKRCKKVWYNRYILGLKTPPSKAQADGIEFHEAIHKMTELNRNIYSEQTQRMIDSLRNDKDFNELKITNWEQKVRGNIGGFEFLGFLDALGTDKDNKECIIEFKSSRAEWKEEDLKNNFIQTNIYSLITGITNFYYVICTKHVKPRVQVFHLEVLKSDKMIIDICNEIKNEFSFEPDGFKNNKQMCYFCDAKPNCEAWF